MSMSGPLADSIRYHLQDQEKFRNVEVTGKTWSFCCGGRKIGFTGRRGEKDLNGAICSKCWKYSVAA